VTAGGPTPHGRLELTWTNKSLRLLAHESGRYEWTDRGDHRVAEVRLLHQMAEYGTADAGQPQNLLIRGTHCTRSVASPSSRRTPGTTWARSASPTSTLLSIPVRPLSTMTMPSSTASGSR